MKRVSLVVTVIAAAAAMYAVITRETRAPDQDVAVTVPEVVVDTPQAGDLITSPLTVTGKARRFWYFEGVIPVALKDQTTGATVAEQRLQAQSEWMTEDHVAFEGTLEFTAPPSASGVVVIRKDNPSGQPELEASFEVPVRFR